MGYYEDQLRAAVSAMSHGDVTQSASAWGLSRGNLADAVKKLTAAADTMKQAFGEDSELGRQGHAAFTKAAQRAETHRAELAKGQHALLEANHAMNKAEAKANHLPNVPDDPGTYNPDPTKSPGDQLKDRTAHDTKAKAHTDGVAEREEQARLALEAMDEDFAKPTQEMKEIHKIPDPPPPPPAGGRGSCGSPSSPAWTSRTPCPWPRGRAAPSPRGRRGRRRAPWPPCCAWSRP